MVDLCVDIHCAGVPGIPDRPAVRERPKAKSLELKWNSVQLNSTGLILYIVESRWNIGKQYNEAETTHWQQVSQVWICDKCLKYGLCLRYWFVTGISGEGS